jgi:hypothetical protein
LNSSVYLVSPTIIRINFNFKGFTFSKSHNVYPFDSVDNIVFSLSKNGFFGSINRATATLVQNTSFTHEKAKEVPWLQIALLSVSLVGMMTGLLVVVFLQASGHFLPSSIIVQFNDEVIPALSTFNGQFILEVSGAIFAQDRVVYRNEIGGGTIGFCSELEAWTFGHTRTNYCENVLAISENPTTRDISLILGQSWYVRISEESERVLPMEGVFSAVSCFNDLDCGGSERGQCQNFRCRCSEGFFGLRCNYLATESCERIKVDELTDPFTGLRRKVSQEYNILRDPQGKIVTAYFHPIYIDSSFDIEDSSINSVDVVLYAGLRWVLSSITPPKDGIHTYFPSSFHASNSTLGHIEATSDIVNFNTAADETSAPTSIGWYLPGSYNIAEIDPVLGIDTVFVCSKCGSLFPCAYENKCDETGKCICENGETGSLCQVIPIGDGKCNEFFNRREFDFDGGDCCEGSCSSGSTHKCGIIAEDGLDNIPVGFPFCYDPTYSCENGNVECWSRKSNNIPLLITNSTGAFVTLSANGRTLVISEPEIDTVRVFDQVDSDWVPRGQILEGEGRSRFGSLVALATLPGSVFKRRTGRVPITIAIAAVGNVTNYVEVYKFDPHAEEWTRLGSPLRFNEVIDAIAIGGGQGGTFNLAVGLKQSNRCYLYLQNYDLNWKVAFNASGSSGVTLSGNGQILGCGSTDPEDPEGSGLFNVTYLKLPDPYDIRVVNKLKLDDLLAFRNWVFKSRPVVGVMDYMGTYGVVGGEVFPGSLGYNGFVLIGVRLDVNTGKSVAIRISEVGFDILETMADDVEPVFFISPDTRVVAINSQKVFIELFPFNSINTDSQGFSAPMYRNTSSLPSYPVKSLANKFALSNGGLTMAVVDDDKVEIVERRSFCNGSMVRLAITLDEEPEAISWSLDYTGYISFQEVPTENIATCRGCYGGDPRYIRVVIVEDFCIPDDKVNCVQITFATERRMGDGAGFIALKDGEKFSGYSGDLITMGTTSGTSGGCKIVCPESSKNLDILMNFQGGFPKEFRNPFGSLIWSSEIKSSEVMGNLLLVQECVYMNETGRYELIGSGGLGNYTIYIDGQEKMRNTFDIGKSQFFELDLDENSPMVENIPSRCAYNCSTCNVCPIGMTVNPTLEIDIDR